MSAGGRCQQCRGWKEFDARRRQFDGQRQAVQTDTNFGDGGSSDSGHLEAGLHCLGLLDKEGDRLVLRERDQVGQVTEIREIQRRDCKLMLGSHVQCHPARHQQLQPGAGGQEFCHLQGRLYDLLKVVQQEEQALLTQKCVQKIEESLPLHLVDTEGLSNLGGFKL
jgi:hypothetical protein